MNKAEFAVCRIKEKLPGNQGFATKGSGCVVHCEKLTSSWGWKCHYFIVTPSVVLCRDDLSSDKIFLAEFLSKDKRGLETFEMKQMGEVCKDAVGRRLDNLDQDLYLTFISVEPLDKRGFLKKMVKKGSLQTFRPLDCFDSENKSVEELTEGLYCHVISNLFGDPTASSPFSTQTFKLVYELETGEFSLRDFGGSVKTFHQEIPPIGAVIFTNKGEFAGVLRNFSDNCVTAIFLPESSIAENGQGEDISVSKTGGEAHARKDESSTEPEINLGQENHSISDTISDSKSTDDTSQVETVSDDPTVHQENTLQSSGHIPAESDSTNTATSEALISKDENSDSVNRDVREEESSNTDITQDGSNAVQQFQECPDHLIPGVGTEKVETENPLMSVDCTTNGETNFEKCEEKGGLEFPDKTGESFHEVEVHVGQGKEDWSVKDEESRGEAKKEPEETEEGAFEEGEHAYKSSEGPDKIKSLGGADDGPDEAEGEAGLMEGGPGKMEEGPVVEEEGTCSAEEGPFEVEGSTAGGPNVGREGSFNEEEGPSAMEGAPDEVEGGPARVENLEDGDVGREPAFSGEEGPTVGDGAPDKVERGPARVEDLRDGDVGGEGPSSAKEGLGEVEGGTDVVREGVYSVEEGPCIKEDESPVEVEGSYKTENGDDSEAIVPDSETETEVKAAGDTHSVAEMRQTITRHDSSLTTVIQVGEAFAQMEITENKEQTEHGNTEVSVSENVPAGNQCMTVTEQSGTEEPLNGSLPDNEEPSTDNSMAEKENVIANNTDVCAYTDSEPTELDGTKPDVSSEKDFVCVAMETSKELSQGDQLSLVSQEDQEVSDVSEKTVNVLYDKCDISICITPPLEDVIETDAKDEGSLKEYQNNHGDLSENTSQIDSSDIGSPDSETTVGEETKDLQTNVNVEIEVHEQENNADVALTLEKTEAEDNIAVAYNEVKEFDEHAETDVVVDTVSAEQYSLKLNGNQTGEDEEAVITQKEFVQMDENGIVVADVCEHFDHKRIVSSEEKTAESNEDLAVGKTHAEDNSTENSNSSNIGVSEKIIGQELVTVTDPVADSVQNGDVNDQVQLQESSLSESIVLQRVNADALLTETVTNNPHILGDLGMCLDTEYQYGRVPCWRDLAELLAIPPEVYEHCGNFSATSHTEDLFVFLAATKPQLTIQDIKEALREIDRIDVAQLLDRKIAGGIISEESVVASLVERDDTDILARIALKLDKRKTHNWKHLALQLNVPHRVLRNFGSHQQHNSSLMLLKYIPIFDPELTLDHLKRSLASIGRQDAVIILDKAGIPGDEPVKDILDDSELLDQITDLLNEDPLAPHWRHLAKELKIPQEKCKIFEPTEDKNSPTKLLFKSIEDCEPDLTFEELVLALVAMKRQDVLDVLQKYFSSDDIDQILEENNLLAPAAEGQPDEKKVTTD